MRSIYLIRKAGRISFCVQQPEYPYKYVTVDGSLLGVDQPPSVEQILTIVRRYLPEEQAQGFVAAELANQGPKFALYTVRPKHCLNIDSSDAGSPE